MIGTVRARLFLLVALLVLPSLAISAFLTWQIYSTARSGAEMALREAAHGLDQLVDREFIQAEVLLRTLAATSELQRGDLQDFDRLARATTMTGGAVVLTDNTGQELLNTAFPQGAVLPSDGPPIGWAGARAGVPKILPIAPVAYAGVLAMQIVVAVDVADHHAYDLKLVLPTSSIQAILLRQKLPDSWISSIMDPRGILAARTRDPDRYVGHRSGPDLVASLARSDEGTRDGTSIDGTPVVVMFSRSAQTGWIVAVASPRALVVREGRKSATLLGLLGTVIILAGVLVARRIASSIARPVEALANSARVLGEGRAWQPIPAGLTEADAVASALQAASTALAVRQTTLSDLNAGLSARVDERTHELAEANIALDLQRRTLPVILDQMPVGVLVHKPDCTLSMLNLEARRLLHIPLDAKPAAEWPTMRQNGHILPLQDTPTILACRGHTTERAQVNITCKSGRNFEVEISASPLRDRNGQVCFAVTVFQDVTARVEAEEARRRSQRLEAVGQLTGGVAHEFNNLLLAITGCLELLGKPIARLGDTRAQSLLANAARAAGRGNRLTTQLLAFARRQALQMEPLDLQALVTNMKELLEGTLGRAVQIVVASNSTQWPAMADASQVELMLLNLAINARDAMPGGGVLTIRTDCVRTGPPVRAEDPPEGDHAVLHVSDTGHGMPAHVLARAFEPFFTTKEFGKGSGLGLPQVLGVAQQMGGGVTIASLPNIGTTVSVFLPRAFATAAPPSRATSDMHTTVSLGGMRVLLVDDDLDVRVVTTAILEELGGVVTEAESGAAGLLELRTRSFDVVLADLTMPSMTGLEMADEVAALFPGLPVVLMTGYGPAALGDPGPNIRATLQKPFRAEALARLLTGVVGHDVHASPAQSA